MTTDYEEELYLRIRNHFTAAELVDFLEITCAEIIYHFEEDIHKRLEDLCDEIGFEAPDEDIET